MPVTRSEPRQSQQSPIRIFGMNDVGQPINLSAWTVDVSRHGARVKGVREWASPGEEVGVRCGLEKARFKVVWVGQNGTPHEGQIGLLCVEAGKYIWGIAAPEVAKAAGAPAGSVTGAFHFASQLRAGIGLTSPAKSGNNRRSDARYHAHGGGARVQAVGAAAAQWATLHDLSMGGCYVETSDPLPLGATVDVTVHIHDIQITAKGAVTVSHRLVGMGLKFGELSPLNRARLEQVMATLMETSTEA